MVDFVNMDVCYANQSTASTASMCPAVVEHVLPKTDADTTHSAENLSEAFRMVNEGLNFATFPLNFDAEVAEELKKTTVKFSAQVDHTSDTPYRAMVTLASYTTPSQNLNWAVSQLFEKFEPTVRKELIQEGTYSLTRMIFQHPEQVNSYAWWHVDPFHATRVMFVLKGEGTEFCELSAKLDKKGYLNLKDAYSVVKSGFVNYGPGIVKPERLTDSQRHEATELTRNVCDPARGHKFYSVKEGYGVVFKPGHVLHRAPLDFKGERILSTVEVLWDKPSSN